MESSDRKEKQDYLKKEIIAKGYDREEFAEFMMEQKEDGLNVDNWEFRELIMAMDDFVSTHKPVVANEYTHEDSYQPSPSNQDYSHNDYNNDDYEDGYNFDANEPSDRDTYYTPEPEPYHAPSKVSEITQRSNAKIEALKKIQEEERQRIKDLEKQEEEKFEKEKKKMEKKAKRKDKKESKESKKKKRVRIWI